MDPEYQLIFEDIPRRKATSIAQAINSLFSYLNAILRTYLNSPEAAGNEQGWIAINVPGGDIRIANEGLAKNVLEEHDKVDLYCQSKNLGVFHTASAIEVTLYEMQRQAKDSPPIKQGTQKADQTIESLPSHDDNNWIQPSSINPIDILEMAETRIFSHNLYLHLSESKLPLGTIDELAHFEIGTCLQMLHSVDPLRPTPQMVKSIAKVLCVKPAQLWINFVPYYLDKTGTWAKHQKKLELTNK